MGNKGTYDLTILKQYVKDEGIMERFTPEQQAEIKQLGGALKKCH
jgi:hypothetical protein